MCEFTPSLAMNNIWTDYCPIAVSSNVHIDWCWYVVVRALTLQSFELIHGTVELPLQIRFVAEDAVENILRGYFQLEPSGVDECFTKLLPTLSFSNIQVELIAPNILRFSR